MPAPAPVDCMLPDSWYDHHIQSKLIMAGIKYPVYTNALQQVFPEGTNMPSAKVVYVPHFGDMSFDHLGDNVLAEEDNTTMCILITPPIPSFSYEKFRHGIINQDGSVSPGYLPDNFVHMASQSIQISFHALHNQLYQMMDNPPAYTVMGSKLSPLSSGKANIAIFIKFHTYESPFQVQSYYDIPGSNFKIRIIPKPIITRTPNEKLHEINITFDVLNPDNHLFQHAHAVGSRIVSHDLKLNFKHAKVIAGSKVSLVAHSKQPVNLSTHHARSLSAKISYAIMPYIVTNIRFES
jgi:hypothetical protein